MHKRTKIRIVRWNDWLNEAAIAAETRNLKNIR